ncbi:MAG: acyl-CoA thioester hydrolase [Oscillospiraceae bacterium]|nr:acyl-CoA thioester hydrolase [Oscillospiraceae bacterium]
MKREYFDTKKDGFYGAYFKNPENCSKGVILMLGDKIDDLMVKMGVKWLHRNGCNVLTMASDTKDYSYHDYPIESFEKAIAVLKDKGNVRFGVFGASTTAMMALAAASFIPDLTLTIALSPSDFIMEGFYRDGLNGAKERPGNHESTLSYRGKSLPYLPYAYRHPEYWQKLSEEAKRRGDMAAARDMFDLSEQRCPLTEDMKIKVERIKGYLVLVGAQDDSLWDTCRYIDRMTERLKAAPHTCRVAKLTYEYGSHLVFPQSMLETVLPFGSTLLLRFAFRTLKEHPQACKQTRINIDRRLRKIIQEWR